VDTVHEVGFTQAERAEFFAAVSDAVSVFPFIGDALVLTCWADDGNEVEMAEFPLGNLRLDFIDWFKEFFNE
jgi:hypothetical protein